MDSSAITFDELDSTLREAQAPIASAAEAHGIICGALCAPAQPQHDRWQSLIFGSPSSIGTDTVIVARALDALYEQTQARLNDESLSFNLFIPDDTHDLLSRTDALADWCRGFLFGLVTSGVKDIDRLPGSAPEILHDIQAISEVAVDEPGDVEEQEEALTELEEYVRMGVQLIYEELHPTPTH
jgi:uncharacterized protein YgfB (UPF0149 family)